MKYLGPLVLDCPKCGGPMFEMMVRRFSDPLPGYGRAAGSINEPPPRTDFADGRECRKCRTFYPA